MKFDNELAKEYDKGIRRTLPTYDPMFRLIQAFLRNNLMESAHVLVIGAGGGAEIQKLGETNPNWHFTGVDPSKAMLTVAQSKVEESLMTNRVKLIQGTVEEIPISSSLFDGATCILVLHFIPTYEEKLKTLQKAQRLLRKGAPFVLVTKFGDPTEPQFEELIQLWKSYWLDTTNLQPEQVNEMEQSIRQLSYIPEEEIRQLLQEAGFTRIAKFFSTTLFGGWICHTKND